MIFRFGTWQIWVDVKAMQAAVPTLPPCDCAACRTFAEHVGGLPDAVKQPFSALGLNMATPAEVFDEGADENGRHRYGGWWNLYGHIIQKGETAYELADGMEVTFAEDGACVPKWFQPSCLQMRFTVKGKHLKRLGKEYRVSAGQNIFIYHLNEQPFTKLQKLVGAELVGLTLESPVISDLRPLFREVDMLVKNHSENGYSKVSLTVSRDLDTCFEGIDRMSLALRFDDMAALDGADIKSSANSEYPRGRIKAIQVFESTIEGERDKVIYDSHVLVEFDGGERFGFRVEPDGAEAIQPFLPLKAADMGSFLRVSDTWFSEEGQFYRTNTVMR